MSIGDLITGVLQPILVVVLGALVSSVLLSWRTRQARASYLKRLRQISETIDRFYLRIEKQERAWISWAWANYIVWLFIFLLDGLTYKYPSIYQYTIYSPFVLLFVMVLEWGEIHKWVKGRTKKKSSFLAYHLRSSYTMIVLLFYAQLGLIAFYGINGINTGIYALITNGFNSNPDINGTLFTAEFMLIMQITIYRTLDSMADVEDRLFVNTRRKRVTIEVTTNNTKKKGYIKSIGNYLIISDDKETSAFEWLSLKELSVFKPS